MGLAKFAIENRSLTYFVAVLLILAGVASFFSLGQLEDPEFTVKTAVIATAYPGASPEEVELEVTDRIELAIQELPEVNYVESSSRAGMSQVVVEIEAQFWSDKLPQIWDEMRRKIRDIEADLPPGAARPMINDDFGDVFGFQLAVVGDGFSYGELEEYAKDIKKEISLVEGVARVDLWGEQQKIVYLDVKETQLSQLGITDASLLATLDQQNMVVDGGSVDVQSKRFRIAPTGEFRSPRDIADLTLRAALMDQVGKLVGGEGQAVRGKSGELIRIRDIGEVRSGYLEPPQWMMRFDGRTSIGISITNVAGVNIVEVGERIDTRLRELEVTLPVGVEMNKVHWMSDVVDQSVQGFLVSFAQAVAIVLVVIALGMGLRMSLIIGTALVATILASFVLMAVFDIPLQRMSLGALIIALGMMVDNAIVVADGMTARLQKGVDRVQAAIDSAQIPAMPLLGSTIIAIMAFYPIFASVEAAGEYCRTLFTVVAIGLGSSWLVSMTITPLQCLDLVPSPKKGGGEADPYAGGLFQRYRSVLQLSIRNRFLTIGVMLSLLVVAGMGFGNVKQLFFPAASMTKFMIDYWAPEGTRIQQVAADLVAAEEHLLGDERVASVATFVGQGPPRFYLPVDPESAYASYAQLIVNVHDFKEIDGLISDLTPWFHENYPEAQVPMRKFGVGPSNTWQFEVRISGPGNADAGVLRQLADRALGILAQEPLAGIHRSNWRERVQRVEPLYSQERARWAAITREDVANGTKRAFDGVSIGLYREKDDLIPIVLRHAEEDRANVSLNAVQMESALATETVPLEQVVDGIPLRWEDPMTWRRDRRRTITVEANPVAGVTLPTLRAAVLPAFDALAADLPPGYTLEWGGEHEDTVDAQASLAPGAVPALLIIAIIVVGLFNAFKPPLVILCTVPFALIGISAGLLAFDVPFGFVALLAAMSLAGMMIKNAIVLLDQVNINLAEGLSQYEAIVDAAMSRLRPVFLAAATTVLGVVPLLQDSFWIGLAVTIMAGLAFGTVLTMILVPVFYCTFYGIRAPNDTESEHAPLAATPG